jgi:hypothetical protein
MFGAVEWIRTTTVFLPPAPQAGASANSATTAPHWKANCKDFFKDFSLPNSGAERQIF